MNWKIQGQDVGIWKTKNVYNNNIVIMMEERRDLCIFTGAEHINSGYLEAVATTIERMSETRILL
jgi:hypothetical protein